MSEENLTMKDLETELNASLEEAAERNQKLAQVDDEDQGVWENLLQLQEEDAVLDVTVSGVVKGGVIAMVDGIRAFIPASEKRSESKDYRCRPGRKTAGAFCQRAAS